MNHTLDINNRVELKRLLLLLDPATKPLWGKMTPQQMVEHLVDQVEYTNGKKIPTYNRPPEEAKKIKEKVFASEIKIPRNVVFGELPEQYVYPDLATAINQLMQELDRFDEYFKEPGITAIHGGFGPLDYPEWVLWHSKHFTHHLQQFALLEG